jgi:RNA polymerase sigma-70 factor, ECF subfamily
LITTMDAGSPSSSPNGAALSELDLARRFEAAYRRALPEVYGYLRDRCGDVSLAEDLTADTFVTAARRWRDGDAASLDVPWLITVARNKLVDYWRRAAREERRLRLVGDDQSRDAEMWPEDEPFDLDALLVTMQRLAPQHRLALTLRYLDGLSVPEVAAAFGRTVHATEAVLVRARRALRQAWEDADHG